MVKSMFAGVAGLRTHQSKMDIIGNNIANVNTWGYKAASMSFKDTMYQTTSSSSGGSTKTGGYGGTNAGQVGYGVTTGSISYDFGKGGMAPSANGLDCMIDGTGFFIVGPMINGGSLPLGEEDALKSSGLYLSRVGKFQVDGNGYLTDDSGNYVYGFTRTGGLTDSTSFDTTALTPLKIPTKSDMSKVSDKNATDKIADAKKKLEEARALFNAMDAELGNARDAYIAANDNYKTKYTAAGVDTAKADMDAKKTAMDDAYRLWLEDKDNAAAKTDYLAKKTDYDKANSEFIVAQANVRKVTALAAAKVTELNDAVTAYTTAYSAYIMSDASTDPNYETKKTAYTTAKAALDKIQTELSKIEDKSPEGLRDSAKQVVDAATAKLAAAKTAVENAEKTLTTAQNSAIAVGNAGADDTLATLTNYKIQTDGTVVGTSEEGVTIVVGKIALAGVQNTGGLEKDSGYYYTLGANTGNVSVYEGGGTDGRILGNYLEQAKVDLATEMTEMITTQRGFQANSKIITVTDQMLDELVNMKR